MEEKMNVINDKNHSCGSGCCGCGMCNCNKMGMMRGGRCHLLKKLILLIILIIVFWFGTKLGELKALMQYSRGEHTVMMRGNDMYGPDMGGYMMSGDTTPATPTPTPAQ
jgi:hypothetical protein